MEFVSESYTGQSSVVAAYGGSVISFWPCGTRTKGLPPVCCGSNPIRLAEFALEEVKAGFVLGGEEFLEGVRKRIEGDVQPGLKAIKKPARL